MMIALIVLLQICQGVGAQNFEASRVVTDTVYSEVLKSKRAYTILLPPNFNKNTGKTYPILYLFHGMYGKNSDWTDNGHLKEVFDRLLASGESCEMLIVSPDAGGGDPNIYQNGYFNIPNWAYEAFFYTEFLPYIEKQYRAKGTKEYRAIAGLSMGGGGATSYAQRHADMFCAVYAMSALMDIPQQGAATYTDEKGKLALLTHSVIENSCVKYVLQADEATKQQLRTVRWFVDCGDDDFLLARNIDFYGAMRQNGIPCEFRVRDGAHDWEYWHSALYICLPFVTRTFGKKEK